MWETGTCFRGSFRANVRTASEHDHDKGRRKVRVETRCKKLSFAISNSSTFQVPTTPALSGHLTYVIRGGCCLPCARLSVEVRMDALRDAVFPVLPNGHPSCLIIMFMILETSLVVIRIILLVLLTLLLCYLLLSCRLLRLPFLVFALHASRLRKRLLQDLENLLIRDLLVRFNLV